VLARALAQKSRVDSPPSVPTTPPAPGRKHNVFVAFVVHRLLLFVSLGSILSSYRYLFLLCFSVEKDTTGSGNSRVSWAGSKFRNQEAILRPPSHQRSGAERPKNLYKAARPPANDDRQAISISSSSNKYQKTMKVETPQILWHAEEKNLPAALLSLDVQGDILATAGQGIHLWRLNNHQQPPPNTDNNDGPKSASAPAVITNPKLSSAAISPPAAAPPRATFITALKCHDRPVNRIAFHGRYLASAGDAGDIVIFYPLCRNWADVQHENDVRYTNAGRSGEAVTDLCWSGDGRRLVVGTIDHGVVVVERQDHTATGGGIDDANVSFRIVFRCHQWHAHYVQGVAYDPLNLYIGTASSDRTVKIAVARTVKKQFQLLAPPSSSTTTTFGGGGNKTGARRRIAQKLLPPPSMDGRRRLSHCPRGSS
jgi:WD40 repeat protein